MRLLISMLPVIKRFWLSAWDSYVSYGEIQELFFDGAHLAGAIVQSVKSNNINILKCRGQACDGASAMASEKVGEQARIIITILSRKRASFVGRLVRSSKGYRWCCK